MLRKKIRERLQRVLRLKQIQAPVWIIRHEQVMLFLERRKYLTGWWHEHRELELVSRYVLPLMDHGPELELVH